MNEYNISQSSAVTSFRMRRTNSWSLNFLWFLVRNVIKIGLFWL